MRLYFRDEAGKLRVVDAGEELTESEAVEMVGPLGQKSLSNWIEQNTNVRVKSKVFTLIEGGFRDEEPSVA